MLFNFTSHIKLKTHFSPAIPYNYAFIPLKEVFKGICSDMEVAMNEISL